MVCFEIVLIQTAECTTRLEALKKERQHTEELTAALNKINPHATDDDRNRQASDIDERKRQDRLDNPEKHKGHLGGSSAN